MIVEEYCHCPGHDAHVIFSIKWRLHFFNRHSKFRDSVPKADAPSTHRNSTHRKEVSDSLLHRT